MAENIGQTKSKRKADDTLMGVFGYPKTGSTTAVSYDSAAAGTGLIPDKWYRVVATTACHILFANSGNATTSHMYLAAGIPEVFYLDEGVTRVSAIKASGGTAGILYLTQIQTNTNESL